MTSPNHRPSSRLSRIAAMLMTAALLAGFGCTPKEEPISDFISLHAYSWDRHLGNIEQAVEVSPGRTAYIRRIPLISSNEITRIDTYDVAGGKGICCLLSRHGQALWQAAENEFGGRYAVMMIDGQFRSFVRLGSGRNSEAAFCIDGPFSENDARRMSDNAQRIYTKKHSLTPETWKLGQ